MRSSPVGIRCTLRAAKLRVASGPMAAFVILLMLAVACSGAATLSPPTSTVFLAPTSISNPTIAPDLAATVKARESATGASVPTPPNEAAATIEAAVSQTIEARTGPTATPNPLVNVEQLDEHLGIWRGYVASRPNTVGMVAAVYQLLFPRVQGAYLTRGAEPTEAEGFEPDLSFREFISREEPLPEYATIVERLRFLGRLMDEPANSLSEGQKYAIDIFGTNNQLTFDLAIAGLLNNADPHARDALFRMVQRDFDRFTFESPGGSLLNYMSTNSFLPDFSSNVPSNEK